MVEGDFACFTTGIGRTVARDNCYADVAIK